ncbi:MAG: SDR family oxidoreductase [Acidimicrobiales bacterium]|nr:SDR family oxidoreductase [Acidimicrobiales bacterium]
MSQEAPGRVAVVTGGASGIGLGVVRHLRAAGHQVAALDLQDDALAAAAADLDVLTAQVDVSDRTAVDAAMDRVRSELGPISIIVTSAGIDGNKPFAEISADDWERTLRVNLTGTFNAVQSAVPDLVAGGWGRIITISSSSAQQGAGNRAHYIASKGGVIALTKALSYEYAPLGITANTIPPSIIDTPMSRDSPEMGAHLDAVAGMTPVRRLGTPDDIGAAAAFLASDAAGFITGQQINVNGGWYM